MPPFIELEEPQWSQFLRQLKIAAGDASEVKDLWQRILEPMRADWARRLPGRLARTAKVARKQSAGEIRAGYPRARPGTPFLPWLEFGGTIRHKRGPRRRSEFVPFPFGIRAVPYARGIRRERVKEGRYMGPAVEGSRDDVAREFAEGIQDIFARHFR